MAKKVRIRNANRGGVRIPDDVRQRTRERLERYAEEHFAGYYTRLDIRFHAQFCYVDAYQEPEGMEAIGVPPGSTETLEEFVERLRNRPWHLCRLRYHGDEERWGFCFYTYGNNSYTVSTFSTGRLLGTPEDALEESSVYLTG